MCKIWNDEVYLAAECEERFLVASDIAEMKQYDIFMAGLAHLKEGYRVERSRPDIHTVLVTLEGAGVLSTDEGVLIYCPIQSQYYRVRSHFVLSLLTHASLGKWFGSFYIVQTLGQICYESIVRLFTLMLANLFGLLLR